MKSISFKLDSSEVDKKFVNLYKEVKNVAKNKGITIKAAMVEALQLYLQQQKSKSKSQN